ncbi:cytochrome C biogenesis protein ResB [Paenibacillus swuensis]|uniref:Cytochrome C biogenesis protein ResB n=1 Tax=Paenibacillus swuensis TaxID=1178515 RepID=A0A172TMK5_9BACL|nr:cytochrome c biogenesis protein ResB [Paenibacillus swuensis]ANE48003.1 cytochrome C biogenesis protein ResB [Paenibacillus swuensis]
MFQNTKCECGHQNPTGTVLCESCGKPLLEDAGTELLEMRYDGAARRSQRVNPSWIDRIWNFFSSVKIAVYLIVFTFLGATLGTIYPQENTFINDVPVNFYTDNYGTLGKIYYFLGLSHTYESWWFKGLLVMIGTSLVICSLDRVLPLYKALNKQQIRKHLQFLTRQKVTYSGTLPLSATEEKGHREWVGEIAAHLKKKRYHVHTDGTALLAEKHRFSRWGPYINHIGLIIFLLAVLARSIPGWHMDHYMGFPEGETLKVPETHYYLKNEQFTVDFYQESELPKEFQGMNKVVAKLYETKAVLYECTADCDSPTKKPVLKEVERHDIIVNNALEYKGFMAYQFDFDAKPKLQAVNAKLENKKTGQKYGPFLISMNNPESEYKAGPYTLQLENRFLDFTINENGEPATKGREANAPAFIFFIKGPDLPAEGLPYMYFPKQVDKQRFGQDRINGAVSEQFSISVDSMQDVQFSNYTSYLNLRVDKAMPYIWTGAVIFMIGVIMGLYWQHRRIWLRIDGNQLTVGAHTNKNWFGMRNDVAHALMKMGIEVEPKQLEQGGKET